MYSQHPPSLCLHCHPQVFELDRTLAELPAQATPCSLAGVVEPPQGWADAQRELNICESKSTSPSHQNTYFKLLFYHNLLDYSFFKHLLCPSPRHGIYSEDSRCQSIPALSGAVLSRARCQSGARAHQHGIRYRPHQTVHTHVTGTVVFVNSISVSFRVSIITIYLSTSPIRFRKHQNTISNHIYHQVPSIEGGSFHATVCYADFPGRLYIQKVSDNPKLEQLMADLEQDYSKSGNLKRLEAEPKIGRFRLNVEI